MYYFTPETIAQANRNIENLDAKAGGLFCVLSCLMENIDENISYTIDGEKLRQQLSMTFDKVPKESFDNAKPSYIIFAIDWASSFFNKYIKNRIDLLSCAVFFLRRHGFEREYTKDEVIETFVKHYNLKSLKDSWFFNGNNLQLAYNQSNVEDNQVGFYSQMNYVPDFKSILFNGIIQKSAADLKAAGQIQTLYSGSGVQACFLLSDEPLNQYYIMYNSKQLDGNETEFRTWLGTIKKSNGEPYSQNTLNQYMSAIKAVPTEFAEALSPYATIFNIADGDAFAIVKNAIVSAVNYADVNAARGNGALSACLDLYGRFLSECDTERLAPVRHVTGYPSTFARNRILFGAPGTGKSYTINGDRKELLYGSRTADEDTIDKTVCGEYERVTFHPDYSYANFVGTYKPVPIKDSEGKDAITYSYVPGPFMRTYVKALKNSRTDTPKPYLLIIEEINRANVAAVFGDVFQLLDRDDEEKSEYPIQASEDIKKYLTKELGGEPDDYSEIRIPDNMFIWATMNSADQGVFPMDTAFKRRWDFTYLGIDKSEDGIKDYTVSLGEGTYRRNVNWNELRKAINSELLAYKVNEDKLMGPYFISEKVLKTIENDGGKNFIRVFKNKVLMYLFDDAAKQKRPTLFGGCDESTKTLYSKICEDFDKRGVSIFCKNIADKFPQESTDNQGE